jgi:hypothetical protein
MGYTVLIVLSIPLSMPRGVFTLYKHSNLLYTLSVQKELQTTRTEIAVCTIFAVFKLIPTSNSYFRATMAVCSSDDGV